MRVLKEDRTHRIRTTRGRINNKKQNTSGFINKRVRVKIIKSVICT